MKFYSRVEEIKLVKERDAGLKVGRQLAEYVTSLSFKDLPDEVILQTKKMILDAVGCMYLGSKWNVAKKITGFLKEINANQDCTVVGADFKTDFLWAAFANASYAQIHDCNDGHLDAAAWGGTSHVGRVAIPTALAVGEKLGLSGKEVITAIVIGYDVGVRVRNHKESTPSSAYLSAAIAGKLMKLDENQIRFAMGISGYNSPKSFPKKQADTNFLSSGYLAKVGIESAMLAKEGLFGPPLEDDRRLTKRFSERGLGKEYEIMTMYLKPYPTCKMTAGPLDAIFAIKKESNLQASEVEEITIHQLTHGMYIAESKVDVDSYYKTCEFNLPYIMACAIIDGEVTDRQFTEERIADQEVHDLAKKIKVIADEDLDAIYPQNNMRPTIVEVKKKNGEILTKRIDFTWGSPQNPINDDDLYDKFFRYASPTITEKRAREIKQKVYEFEKLKDIGIFTELLSL